MRSLTIFWTALARGDVDALEEAVREHDAVLAQVSIESLPLRVPPALASGAVIVVCGSNRDATIALSSGVDEVLRAGETTRESLQAAIERALARSSARTSHGLRRALIEGDEDVALGVLGAAFGGEIAEPLERAAQAWDRLAHVLPNILDASDDFLTWSAQSSHDTPRRIAVRRLAGPTTEELKSTMESLRDSLGRVRGLVRGMLSLSHHDDVEISASTVVLQVVDLLRGAVTGADVTAEAHGPCMCIAPQIALVVTVSSLLAHALESVRTKGAGRGTIAVRVFTEEDAVIIEVQDDGAEIPADLRPDMMDPYFRDPTVQRHGLPGLRDRIRRLGGDLVVDSGSHGNNVRVILPARAEGLVSLSAAEPAQTRRQPD